MATTITTPRGRVHVDDGGPGSAKALPIVLVHGLAGSMAHWSGLLPILRRTRRTVALDLPGMGSSEPPRDGDFSVEANAEAVLAVADELGLARFALAGHSYGGNVVAHLSATRPERVAGVAYLDAGRYIPSAADLEEMRRGFRPPAYARFVEDDWYVAILAGGTEPTRATVLAGLRATSREVFMLTMYGATGYDLRAAAERYPGPKLALCAEILGVAGRWEGAPVQVRIVRGVSHWLQLDAPDEVAAHLEAFVAPL